MSASSVHASAPPPVVVDPEGLQYETGPQLGKGGFAICHKAKLLGHEHLGSSTVALKIVKSKMEPPKLAQKFVTELQIHSKLQHPSIVEFYRAFSFEASTFVVLELCENGSLADAIKKRKYFTMPEIRRFMIQTCGAIKYLHQRNIVHRDLKTGNLFLDKDMNVKVGDFGLAALLLSQNDFGAIRRTTMCGTPNYLAPEVLEKTGRGHDEKVDLWAIGIMMYTLAVGRAPFHAAKREDIYRKLKAREYSWPDPAKVQNEITDDLRDVVSSLLVHEDERPTPDEIVNHPFFKLGFIPLTLDKSCTSSVPKWPKVRPPSSSTVRRGYTKEWFELCKVSSVGEYEPGKSFGAYGSRRNKTVARDCQKEIESGKQPNIPFASDTVYLPFPARTHWPFQSGGGLSEIPEEKESSSEGTALVDTTSNGRVKGRLPRVRRTEEVPRMKENMDPEEEQPAEPLRRPTLDRQPTRMRSVRKIATQSRTAATATTVPLRVPKEGRSVQRTSSTKDAAREETAQEVLPVRASKASTVPSSQPEPPHPFRTTTTRTEPPLRSIGPELPSSDPEAILAQLQTFRDNIARALQKKPLRSRQQRPQQLPFVSKWVDYSRKHGVGFVLEDGTVGCLAVATEKHPVTTALVHNGHAHLFNVSKDPDHMARLPIQYFAATDESAGISRVEILEKQRRDHLRLIWAKFGKYMCVQLGNDDQAPKEMESQNNFVKFYQRLGNVGFWGFGDGSFQVNFPDHTKLILSPSADYANFICLSVEATHWLRENGNLPWKHIKERKTLHGSLQQLLYGSADRTADPIKQVTQGNALREKLQFIMSVADGWIQGGGLGCLETPQNFTWQGTQLEENKKLDWASVGRLGGDVV